MSPATAMTSMGTVPTRSQIQNWESAHLDRAAARWRVSADESESLFAQHRQNIVAPGGTEWTGRAKDAALDRVTADLAVVGRQSDTLREAAGIASNGAGDVRAAQRKAVEAIAEAEADGFRVSEDLSVRDTQGLATAAARHTAAREHAENIRWNAEQLLATDTLIGKHLAAKAADLQGITFEESGDGSIQMLDTDDGSKSPVDEAKDRAAEPRTPVPEAGTWPPPGTPIWGGTPGGESYGRSGLGPPVPGTSLPERPKPPAWQPKDIGTGGDSTFNTWEPRLPSDQLDKWEVDAAKQWIRDDWPHAARNMDHYFGVSGQPLDQDVRQMLHDIPTFGGQVDTVMQNLGADAIGQAQAAGATGPLTFPINTDWNGISIPSNGAAAQRDWYLAMGNFDYNMTGQVTVHPPVDAGAQWTYSLDSDVNIRDRYNWDLQKATPIAGTPITDSQMGRFHMIGWAKEFTMIGSTGVHSAG